MVLGALASTEPSQMPINQTEASKNDAEGMGSMRSRVRTSRGVNRDIGRDRGHWLTRWLMDAGALPCGLAMVNATIALNIRATFNSMIV